MKRVALAAALPALLLCFALFEANAASAQTQQLQITNGPSIEGVGNTWAVIAWTTNTGGSSIIRYGTSPNALNQTAEAPYSNNSATQAQNHRVRLNNLQPNTTYYFTADSTQGEGTGTQAISPVEQFTTPASGTTGTAAAYYPGTNSAPLQIINGPIVQNVSPTSAMVSWMTNAGGSSVVHYGTAPNALYQTAQAPYVNNTVTQEENHTVTLNNLQPNTTYYFYADSGQGRGSGTAATSRIFRFRTPA